MFKRTKDASFNSIYFIDLCWLNPHFCCLNSRFCWLNHHFCCQAEFRSPSGRMIVSRQRATPKTAWGESQSHGIKKIGHFYMCISYTVYSVYTCMYKYIHVCFCVYVYVCMCVRVYVCMCVRV